MLSAVVDAGGQHVIKQFAPVLWHKQFENDGACHTSANILKSVEKSRHGLAQIVAQIYTCS